MRTETTKPTEAAYRTKEKTKGKIAILKKQNYLLDILESEGKKGRRKTIDKYEKDGKRMYL